MHAQNLLPHVTLMHSLYGGSIATITWNMLNTWQTYWWQRSFLEDWEWDMTFFLIVKMREDAPNDQTGPNFLRPTNSSLQLKKTMSEKFTTRTRPFWNTMHVALLIGFPGKYKAKLFNNFLSILHYFDIQTDHFTHTKENHDVLSRLWLKMPTDRFPIHDFQQLTMIAHDLVDGMLSFEARPSTPSLSKHVSQNSAFFFRRCFASFFRLFCAQNERYEVKITSKTINQMQGNAGMCSLLGYMYQYYWHQVLVAKRLDWCTCSDWQDSMLDRYILKSNDA